MTHRSEPILRVPTVATVRRWWILRVLRRVRSIVARVGVLNIDTARRGVRGTLHRVCLRTIPVGHIGEVLSAETPLTRNTKCD